MRTLRTLVVGIAAFIAFAAASSSALALTISPSGAYSAASGTVVIRLSSNGQALTCMASRLSMNVSSNGTGSILAGGAAYSGCSNALLGTFTITAASAWTLAFLLVPAGGSTLFGFLIAIPTDGLVMSNGSCQIFFGGGWLYGATFTPGTLPLTVPTTTVFTLLAVLSFRVTRVVNCSPIITTVGLAASFSASYSLSRALTVS